VVPQSDPVTDLPRGIFYEKKKRRYRVRLYRNNCVHFGGYYRSYAEAEAAWEKLKRKLRRIPKLARNAKPEHKIFAPDLHGISKAIKAEKFRNPNSVRVAKK